MYDISKFKIKAEPVILGIESSCDETACAVLRGRRILSNRIISSAAEQAKYGGVVPEIASRMHTEAVDEVCRLALQDAGLKPRDIDCVAATSASCVYEKNPACSIVNVMMNESKIERYTGTIVTFMADLPHSEEAGE